MSTSPNPQPPRSKRSHRRLAIAASLAIAGIQIPVGAGAQGGPPNWPPEIKNLQVFPKDTPASEVIETMKGFTAALGVRCQFCHVGEEGQPIFSFDFASDEKEHKHSARLMLRMVQAINNEHLSKLDAHETQIKVECVTCHRGTSRPEQLDGILARVASAEGPEAAVSKYGELRESHYGGQSYDFSERSLIGAAERLAEGGNLNAAGAMLELNLEHFPESTFTLGTLAQIRHQQGDTDAAIAALQKAVELDPENGRVRAMLEQLKAPATETAEPKE